MQFGVLMFETWQKSWKKGYEKENNKVYKPFTKYGALLLNLQPRKSMCINHPRNLKSCAMALLKLAVIELMFCFIITNTTGCNWGCYGGGREEL